MKAKAFSNNQEIKLNPFIEEYVAEVFAAAIRPLKGVDNPKVIEFVVKGRKIDIKVDDKQVEFHGFAKVIVTDTLIATLKHLKGFSEEDEKKIVIES
ncbi:MAG: hypothetical protein JW984_14800 [Deltaproteobacteria bacterium]|uniref:Uncharacterized protein n=1 Tax=Candidatus Zymogenus saltonus TaxID=2844893 RepID=A0A9D8KGW5_9DELT|nr:hypothetical protein [Candidatus Zymogenus saltonus]